MSLPKGFFDTLLTASEKRDIEAALPDSTALIRESINISRIAARRILKQSKKQNLEEQIKTLCVLSAVLARTATLVRAHEQLRSGQGDSDSELRKFIDSVIDDASADWPKP